MGPRAKDKAFLAAARICFCRFISSRLAFRA
eukprot:SAG11_NODE_24367_length_374_cov_0.992727_2_plen_30_part_01